MAKKKTNPILVVVVIIIFMIVAKQQGFLGAVGDQIDATASYTPSTFSMTSGCNGDIKLAPTSAYDLEVCLNDGTNDYGCKTYTSGEYGVGDILSTMEAPITEGDYRLKLHWKRIKDPQGNYDHNEEAISTHYSTCTSLVSSPNYVGPCGEQIFTTLASSSNECKESTIGIAVGGYYFDSNCINLANPTGGTWYYKKRDSCRIVENYVRSGGSDATGTCRTNLYALSSYGGCGFCVNDYNSVYYMPSCTNGVKDSCPSSLCTYAGNNIEYTDYFSIGTSSGTTPVSLTGSKISSDGIINFGVIGDCATLRAELGTAITAWIDGGSRDALGTAIQAWVDCV